LKKRYVVAILIFGILYFYQEELIITLTSERSQIILKRVLTSISGATTKIIKVMKEWKLPKFVRKKKKSKFTFTISLDDAKKYADTGYTFYQILKRRRQKKYSMFYFFKPDVKVEPDFKKIIKFEDYPLK
jgi:EamA domain-containing membrane protein RarD